MHSIPRLRACCSSHPHPTPPLQPLAVEEHLFTNKSSSTDFSASNLSTAPSSSQREFRSPSPGLQGAQVAPAFLSCVTSGHLCYRQHSVSHMIDLRAFAPGQPSPGMFPILEWVPCSLSGLSSDVTVSKNLKSPTSRGPFLQVCILTHSSGGLKPRRLGHGQNVASPQALLKE